jgi:hypothetical protein
MSDVGRKEVDILRLGLEVVLLESLLLVPIFPQYPHN